MASEASPHCPDYCHSTQGWADDLSVGLAFAVLAFHLVTMLLFTLGHAYDLLLHVNKVACCSWGK